MVQGVGFRFTAKRLANDLELSGWVRNNRDRTVEIVCEGSEDKLSEFLRKIEDSLAGYIRSKDVNWIESTGEFKDFSIKF